MQQPAEVPQGHRAPGPDLQILCLDFPMSECIQIILESIMSEPAVVSAVTRPEPGEYAPYYGRYISLVPGTDILGTLDAQRRQMLILLSGQDDSDGNFRYAPDK